ncbi:MAG: ATP-binding protein [Candidatus Omnitrophica bacterium]|nr:ATP-binding protein [Candidatus Omnitrophota bacterium]
MSKKIKRLRSFNAQLRAVNEQLKAEIAHGEQAEEQLKAAYQRLSDIIEFLPDAMFVIDQDKRVIAWNRAIEEMTGIRKEDIIGQGDYAYAIPFYGKPRPVLIDLVGMHDKEIEAKYTYVRREKEALYAEVFVPLVYSGKGAFLWVKASPLYDSQRNVVGAMETIRDITERKETEAILRKDKESFERLTKERTEQLLRVQKELADAKHLSEIGSLAATVAHELRNPLAAIRTAAYNIGKKSRNRSLKRHLENIEKKVIESDQIINNLLSYSRIRVPHFAEVRIHEVLNECIAHAKDRFRKWKVAVNKKCTCARRDTIKADALQIKELFDNLLNNAFESLPEKRGRITIRAQYDPRSNFTITFEDTGAGIASEDMKHLMQPFFTTKSKGTGLGLAVCHQLVRLHEGTLTISSEVGKGTTVTVLLPCGHALK